DSKHDVFVAMVGSNTYIYNPATKTWSQFPATLMRPVSIWSYQALTYDPSYDVFVFQGGTFDTPVLALFRYDPTNFPSPAFDNQLPTVAITSPINGATISGTVTLSVN